jgi:hypothetical protein
MTHRFPATCCECFLRQFVDPRDVTHARHPHCYKCGGPLEFTKESLRVLGSIRHQFSLDEDKGWDDLFAWFKSSVGADWTPPEGDEELSPSRDVLNQPLREAICYLAYGDIHHLSATAVFRLVDLKMVEVDGGQPMLTAFGERCFQRLISGQPVPELPDNESD